MTDDELTDNEFSERAAAVDAEDGASSSSSNPTNTPISSETDDDHTILQPELSASADEDDLNEEEGEKDVDAEREEVSNEELTKHFSQIIEQKQSTLDSEVILFDSFHHLDLTVGGIECLESTEEGRVALAKYYAREENVLCRQEHVPQRCKNSEVTQLLIDSLDNGLYPIIARDDEILLKFDMTVIFPRRTNHRKLNATEFYHSGLNAAICSFFNENKQCLGIRQVTVLPPDLDDEYFTIMLTLESSHMSCRSTKPTLAVLESIDINLRSIHRCSNKKSKRVRYRKREGTSKAFLGPTLPIQLLRLLEHCLGRFTQLDLVQKYGALCNGAYSARAALVDEYAAGIARCMAEMCIRDAKLQASVEEAKEDAQYGMDDLPNQLKRRRAVLVSSQQDIDDIKRKTEEIQSDLLELDRRKIAISGFKPNLVPSSKTKRTNNNTVGPSHRTDNGSSNSSSSSSPQVRPSPNRPSSLSTLSSQWSQSSTLVGSPPSSQSSSTAHFLSKALIKQQMTPLRCSQRIRERKLRAFKIQQIGSVRFSQRIRERNEGRIFSLEEYPTDSDEDDEIVARGLEYSIPQMEMSSDDETVIASSIMTSEGDDEQLTLSEQIASEETAIARPTTTREGDDVLLTLSEHFEYASDEAHQMVSLQLTDDLVDGREDGLGSRDGDVGNDDDRESIWISLRNVVIGRRYGHWCDEECFDVIKALVTTGTYIEGNRSEVNTSSATTIFEIDSFEEMGMEQADPWLNVGQEGQNSESEANMTRRRSYLEIMSSPSNKRGPGVDEEQERVLKRARTEECHQIEEIEQWERDTNDIGEEREKEEVNGGCVGEVVICDSRRSLTDDENRPGMLEANLLDCSQEAKQLDPPTKDLLPAVELLNSLEERHGQQGILASVWISNGRRDYDFDNGHDHFATDDEDDFTITGLNRTRQRSHSLPRDLSFIVARQVNTIEDPFVIDDSDDE